MKHTNQHKQVHPHAVCRQVPAPLRPPSSNASAQARLAGLGQLVAAIGHEVQQPLASIALNAEAALRWLDRPQADLAQAKAALAVIVDAASRANDIVRSIRRLAQQAAPEPCPCDLETMVAQLMPPLRSRLACERIFLSTDFAAGARDIHADPVQLRQVLHNLIGNAIDALCKVEGRERTVHIASRRLPHDQILVSVSDAGCGLPRHAPESVFEPLVTSKVDGMGMGLTICRAIIEAHGGALHARPGPVHGSIFEFTVAAAQTRRIDAARTTPLYARQG